MSPEVALAGEYFLAVGTGEVVICGCHVMFQGLGGGVLIHALHTSEIPEKEIQGRSNIFSIFMGVYIMEHRPGTYPGPVLPVFRQAFSCTGKNYE